jgi:long-subunit acyl-CoA synthetase (AMP-forming)
MQEERQKQLVKLSGRGCELEVLHEKLMEETLWDQVCIVKVQQGKLALQI